MDSLNKLLSDRDWDEPLESRVLKKYIRQKFQAEASIQVRDNDIVISAPSAALVTSLRYDIVNLRQAASTKKQIILRIN